MLKKSIENLCLHEIMVSSKKLGDGEGGIFIYIIYLVYIIEKTIGGQDSHGSKKILEWGEFLRQPSSSKVP